MNPRLPDMSPESFPAEVLESTIPVLVDFWAPWCVPCRAFTPQVERVASEVGSRMKVVAVNAEAYPNLASTYEVSGLPALLVFVDGLVVARKHGAAGGYGAILQLINPYLEPA